MRDRFSAPVPLAHVLQTLFPAWSREPARSGDAPGDPPPAHSFRETSVTAAQVPASAAPALEPGCTVPFAGLLIALLMLAAALPGRVVGQTVLFESFDAVTTPTVPAGWTAGDGWATSSSSTSTGSGGNNLAHTGTTASVAGTPAVDLTGASAATISYLARRTSSYAQEALQVVASTDGGLSWGTVVLQVGTALPAATSTWDAVTTALPPELLGQADVRLRFEAGGGSTSGANIRIDDVRISTEGGGGGTGGSSSIGFSTGSSSVPAGTTGFAVGVRMDVDAPEGISAVQFDVTWDDDLMVWGGVVAGSSLTDGSAWTVTAESSGRAATILAVAPGGAFLPTGIHDPVIELLFDIGPLPEGIPLDVSITLTRAIGALAVPTGDDAGLSIATGTHVVTVSPQVGVLEVPASIDLGTAAVGETISGSLTVSNATGTAPLTISSATIDRPAFTVTPASAVVPAGGATTFTVTFTPDGTLFGEQTATLDLTHDGVNGPLTAVTVVARAGAGRGDANGDAVVDLLDLLVGIDVAIGRVQASSAVQGSLDLYPFPTGDGFVDVRDLTVLVQAILLNAWPDGEPLPVLPGSASKGESSPGGYVLTLVPVSGGTEVRIRAPEPMRGLQIELRSDPATGWKSADRASAIAPVHSGVREGRVRVLWTRFDGGLLPSGEHTLGVLSATSPDRVELAGSVVVNAASDVFAARIGEGSDLPGEPTLDLGHPYPNPVVAAPGLMVRIPVQTQAGETLTMRIVDILGRLVFRSSSWSPDGNAVPDLTWPAIDAAGRPVGPGLYFAHVSDGVHTAVRPITVIR